MFNRRRFVRTLGASTVLPALSQAMQGFASVPPESVAGGRGETVAACTLRYASGKSREIPLRNGYEVAQSNLIAVATRIDPQTKEAQRALVFAKDVVREQYQVLMYSLSLEGGELASLHCQLRSQQSALAIFALTVEPAS